MLPRKLSYLPVVPCRLSAPVQRKSGSCRGGRGERDEVETASDLCLSADVSSFVWALAQFKMLSTAGLNRRRSVKTPASSCAHGGKRCGV